MPWEITSFPVLQCLVHKIAACSQRCTFGILVWDRWKILGGIGVCFRGLYCAQVPACCPWWPLQCVFLPVHWSVQRIRQDVSFNPRWMDGLEGGAASCHTVLAGTLQGRFGYCVLTALYLFFRKDKVYVCLRDQVIFKIFGLWVLSNKKPPSSCTRFMTFHSTKLSFRSRALVLKPFSSDCLLQNHPRAGRR